VELGQHSRHSAANNKLVPHITHYDFCLRYAEEAATHFGWFGHFAGLDIRSSSAQTRQQLGWNPTGPGLITDLENMRYA
jgi:hypothetical protein